MQVPAQQRGLHATLISLEMSSDVPAIHFFILICRYGKGLSREPQDMIFLMSSYKTIVGSVTQSRGARPFWGFIPRCHKIDKKDRQWTNQDSIRHTVFQVCVTSEYNYCIFASSLLESEIDQESGVYCLVAHPLIPLCIGVSMNSNVSPATAVPAPSETDIYIYTYYLKVFVSFYCTDKHSISAYAVRKHITY